MTKAVRTTCPYCGVGCGVLATALPDGCVDINGDPDHPANFGRLCSKGSALGQTLSQETRLLEPMIDGAPVSWNTAIGRVAAGFRDTIAAHGPDSVALYVSGQLLTEDYYVANKFMKGFVGSANIDTNSRLCMASSVAGHNRAFGADTVPGLYEDIESADLVVLVGSNLAWCHPVLFQRLVAAKSERPEMKVVNIDPRRTATSEIADIHLALEPGSDVALFQGLLHRIVSEGAVDTEFVASHVEGFEEAIAAAESTVAITAERTRLDPIMLSRFMALWVGTEKVVTIYSQGVNQAVDGTDRVQSILNCHLATGRIGKPGCGPFSITGQPNAMGGREVGGLANMLACHLTIENPEHRASVQDFWQSPTICTKQGLKAVELFDAVADGRIKAIWIMATNPAVSLPEAEKVSQALRLCPLTIVSEVTTESETAKLADILLPAAAWGEKSGTVTNSERVISRQRGFLPIAGKARPDWRIIADVARAMGWADAFDYDSPAEIFSEYAKLSVRAKALGRDLDLEGLSALAPSQYEALDPVRWPVSATGEAGGRFFAEGGFFTPTRKARMWALEFRAQTRSTYLRLNTGRVRDHWHTMTRTGLAPNLARHMAEPFVEIHPIDAARFGIKDATLVRVTNSRGAVLLRALVTDRTSTGTVFAPIHWSNPHASQSRIGVLVAPDTDPISGQPANKSARVQIASANPAWYGFALSRRHLDVDCAYQARATLKQGWQYELAGFGEVTSWEDLALAYLGDAPSIQMLDHHAGRGHFVLIDKGHIEAALFLASEPVGVARAFAVEAFEKGDVEALLAARPGADQDDPGAIVCSCFSVGTNSILNAITEEGLVDVEGIGAALQAGTNCGSCRPELQALLGQVSLKVAAE